MDINKAKQTIKNYFSPYESELIPYDKKPETFELRVYKYVNKDNGIYRYSELAITNMPEHDFKKLIKNSKESLQKDSGFIFDN